MKTLEEVSKFLGRKPTDKEKLLFILMKNRPDGDWRKDGRGKLWWHKKDNKDPDTHIDKR